MSQILGGKPLCAHLGYDPEVVRALPARHRRSLDFLTQAWLVSAAVLAYPLGVAVWMIEHSWLLAMGVAFGTFVFVVNLLRLLTAGSGATPDEPLPSDYRPSLLPAGIFFGFALLMSQPAQLLHATDSMRAEVAQHRAELVASHRAALSELQSAGIRPAGEDTFLQKLARCEFVVLRLKLLWSAPERAVIWTALYLLLVMIPSVLSRGVWLSALQAYEGLRHRRSSELARGIEQQAAVLIRQALSRYSSYEPDRFSPAGPPLRRSPSAGTAGREAAP